MVGNGWENWDVHSLRVYSDWLCDPSGWPDDAPSGPWLRGVDPEWAEPRAVSPDQLLQMPHN